MNAFRGLYNSVEKLVVYINKIFWLLKKPRKLWRTLRVRHSFLDLAYL